LRIWLGSWRVNDYLARMVNRAKWETRAWLAEDAIRADALTSCLRTSSDALSVWTCDGTEDGWTDVVLALMTVPEKDTIDTIDVVLVWRATLESDGFQLVQSAGKTNVEDLKSRHADVVHLDAQGLMRLAQRLATSIADGKLYRRFRRADIKTILNQAIRSQRLSSSQLHEKIAEQLDVSRW